jgi:isoleucyl-tRNA synthetase
LLQTAKLLAPFTPFIAEDIYQRLNGPELSVHLEAWPSGFGIDKDLLTKMSLARDFASKALEARTLAKINVRQPLKTLKIKSSEPFSMDIQQILKDEINVKEIVYLSDIKNDVELDTEITPQLKEEGDLRELIRTIQDLRKEKGLMVGDMAILVVTNEQKDLVDKNKELIKRSTSLKNIEIGDKFELKF